jgi:hypothetical protein
MPHTHDIEATGVVEDVFAHRFVLRTTDRKLLGDLTPKGAEEVKLRAGDEITIEGEMKPSEVKIWRVTRNGKATEIHHPEKAHGPDHEPKHHAHEPAAALRSVRSNGYEVIGKPRGKAKHFEVLARRDGDLLELHVELDGKIRKSKPVRPHDEKWAADLS